MEYCPFCHIRLREYAFLPSLPIVSSIVRTNNILCKSENFNVFPDIAPIVPYHILISPIEHYNSIESFTESILDEFNSIKKSVSDFIAHETTLPTLFFEHGGSACDISLQSTPCIDHAHLHALPCEKQNTENILHELSRIARRTETVELGASYLSIQYNGQTYFWETPVNKRQILRKTIANVLGSYNRDVWQSCLYGIELLKTEEWLNLFENKDLVLTSVNK